MSTESPALGPPVPAVAGGTTTEYANRGWILAVMCLALVMVVAGVSMLANALPSIAADLDASQSSQQWIVDAYALTLAALLLPAGALGDRFGRRGALIVGTAIFGVAAALSALAGSADRAHRAAARSWASAPRCSCPARCRPSPACSRPRSGPRRSASGPASPAPAAPSACWRRARCSSSSPGARSSSSPPRSPLVALRRRRSSSCPPRRPSEHVAFDSAGSIALGLGIGRLVLGIIEGPERGLDRPGHPHRPRRRRRAPRRVRAVELRTDEPLLDPRLFRHRGFATGSASLFLQFFAMFGFFFVSLQFLQLVLGYSTLDAAVALLPMIDRHAAALRRRGHAVGALRPQARRRRGAGASPAVGLRALRDARHRQRLPGRSCSPRS